MKLFEKYILWVIILLIVIVISCLFCSVSIKYAKDYDLSDLANAQIFNLNINTPTSDDYKKYDVNLDGEISNTDVQIIRQMLLGFYDCYIVY